jgi:plastocyanin
MVKPKWMAIVPILVALGAAACGGGGSGTPTPSSSPQGGGGSCSPNGTTVQLSAQNTHYSTDCIAAPANTAFTIAFDNKDSGVPHNVQIFSDAAMTQSVFKGDIVTGPKQVNYSVGSLAAGTYHFHCDVHPSQMVGELVVK